MKAKIIASAALAIMVAACGSSKDANNSNFEKALNTHFAKNCITIQPFVMGADGHGYPVTVSLQQKSTFITQAQLDQRNADATQPLDVLAKAGLLAVSDGTRKERPMFGNGEITVPTKVYTLTDTGKKAIVSTDGTAMCVGRYKVDEVVRFTEPSSAMSHTISEVSFTVTPVDVPDWARSADIQKIYGLGDKLVEHSKATRTLMLASDGWIDASDFGQ